MGTILGHPLRSLAWYPISPQKYAARKAKDGGKAERAVVEGGSAERNRQSTYFLPIYCLLYCALSDASGVLVSAYGLLAVIALTGFSNLAWYHLAERVNMTFLTNVRCT